MGREKRSDLGHGPGSHAKERHKKTVRPLDWKAPLPPGLRARPDTPGLKTKHQTYYELVENKDKKKKLEFQITTDKNPPPGFEFVPIGNPELTTACKEISRELDAMIFIVSLENRSEVSILSQHINRIGHHVRRNIVEKARESIGDSDLSLTGHPTGVPEPIPESQQEINEQADAAIRDLFPRIPHTDRQMIIERAFDKSTSNNGETKVGLAPDITLSRRVQLAVLAHIRHTHTRYDQLLRETSYVNARKAVETLCLDILVKWRGDEETGRDQLDEILREVIVISDSEEDADDEDDEDDDSDDQADESGGLARQQIPGLGSHRLLPPGPDGDRPPAYRPYRLRIAQAESLASRRDVNAGQPHLVQGEHDVQPVAERIHPKRGFKRYHQAARLVRWDEARDRLRRGAAPRQRSPTAPEKSLSPNSRQGRPYQAGNSYSDSRVPLLRKDSLRETPSEVYRALPPRPPVDYMDLTPAVHDDNTHLRRIAEPRGFQEPGRQHQRVMSDTFPTSGRLPVSQPDRQSGPRAVVRPEDLQDYLVPSIEPASPVHDRVSAPVFVRALSPLNPGRPRDYLPVSSAPFARHYSPASPFGLRDDDRPNRRFAAERLEFVRLSSDRNSNPPVAAHDRRYSPTQRHHQDFILIRESVQDGSYRPPPVPAPRRQFVDARGVVLRDEPGRPIVVDDWAVRPGPPVAVPYRTYREEPVRVSHDPEVVEVRQRVPQQPAPANSIDVRRVASSDRISYRQVERYNPYSRAYAPLSGAAAQPHSHNPHPLSLQGSESRPITISPTPQTFVGRVESQERQNYRPQFALNRAQTVMGHEGHAMPASDPRAHHLNGGGFYQSMNGPNVQQPGYPVHGQPGQPAHMSAPIGTPRPLPDSISHPQHYPPPRQMPQPQWPPGVTY